MNGPHISTFGRLTRDPELRYGSNNGTPYCNVGIAVNTGKGQGRDPVTQYFNATFWRYQAENVAANCRKGDEIYVHGSYELRTYTRNDGTQGTSQDISVKEFRQFKGTSHATAAEQDEEAGTPENTEVEEIEQDAGQENAGQSLPDAPFDAGEAPETPAATAPLNDPFG